MTHPVLVETFGTIGVVSRVGVPETTERMVPSFMRPGERVHILQLLKSFVEMATDDVGGR
jgi:hypothetical protein